MYAFRYHKPASLDEAKALLQSADDASLLAGGQTLIPSLKQRLAQPSDLIDLANISGFDKIDISADAITIGAMARHADVAAATAAALPGLAHVAAHIGDPHVRHMGTIGGSIANNDPAADYPALCLALGATIETTDRRYHADDFFTGLFETALSETEIVTRIILPMPKCCAYRKFPNPASRYALVGVCVARSQSGSVSVAITGADENGVFRHQGLEQALNGNFTADAINGVTIDDTTLFNDIHGSRAYRAHLIKVMTRRAVADCG